MHLRALAPPALLVAAALALSATPAGAIMHLYTGTLDGTVALHVSEVSNGGLQTRRLNAALQLHATLPKLQFSDGRFVSQEAGGTVSASGVDLHYLGINRDVDPVDVVDCRTNAVTLTSPPVATPLASFLRTVPPTTIDLIPTTMFDFGRIACGGGWATIAFGARMDYLEPLQQSHFHARIEVPREQLGDSDITLPLHARRQRRGEVPLDPVQARPRQLHDAVERRAETEARLLVRDRVRRRPGARAVDSEQKGEARQTRDESERGGEMPARMWRRDQGLPAAAQRERTAQHAASRRRAPPGVCWPAAPSGCRPALPSGRSRWRSRRVTAPRCAPPAAPGSRSAPIRRRAEQVRRALTLTVGG